MERKLNRNDLEHLISELLKAEPTCVIATCRDEMPRASTVEFFPSGTTIYILTEGGKKLTNIRHNPHVSLAVHAPFAGWNGVRGVQITGTAELGRKGSKVFREGLEAYRIRRGEKSAALPDFMNVIKVTPARIEYIDTGLGSKGFQVKHILEYSARQRNDRD